MFLIKVNPERCKACGLCMHFCPSGGLGFSERFNAAGYHPMQQVEPERCTGCRQCVLMCPDVAIEIYRVVETPAEAAEVQSEACAEAEAETPAEAEAEAAVAVGKQEAKTQ